MSRKMRSVSFVYFFEERKKTNRGDPGRARRPCAAKWDMKRIMVQGEKKAGRRGKRAESRVRHFEVIVLEHLF
jgi:hypothetical protein